LNSPVDHSLTYRKRSFINILHRGRLKKILALLQKNYLPHDNDSYLDVGCSNGYLTKIVSLELGCNSTRGIDNDVANLQIAAATYPEIEFGSVDLNSNSDSIQGKYDLVTCFETLEHVGNLENAIDNLLSYMKPRGSLLVISVPIEVGFWGVVKFLVKMAYGYDLKELGSIRAFEYFKCLIKGGDINEFRPKRDGWGTHFGFDFREIDRILHDRGYEFVALSHLTTRFYMLQVSDTCNRMSGK